MSVKQIQEAEAKTKKVREYLKGELVAQPFMVEETRNTLIGAINYCDAKLRALTEMSTLSQNPN